ncbi:uncharacterized protein EDB91DRAFT_1089924 [Suillus paluster]|uniref:uncharacterized protein n=1 Tax=Suillus paluster TaxID=48578 RepID=UPI001B867E58|nr:uncharacterized protein EDB91DRAFT_1089924 [Suillus paluster]KAG1718636.1 hypothetical protein EDB91DRAFT_1089924 [Suillus paluster]
MVNFRPATFVRKRKFESDDEDYSHLPTIYVKRAKPSVPKTQPLPAGRYVLRFQKQFLAEVVVGPAARAPSPPPPPSPSPPPPPSPSPPPPPPPPPPSPSPPLPLFLPSPTPSPGPNRSAFGYPRLLLRRDRWMDDL